MIDRDCSLVELIPTNSGSMSLPRSHESNHGKVDSVVSVQTLRTSDDPDKQLVEAAKLGDRRAFSELSTRYARVVHQKIFRLIRNREDTEDLVQDTLLKAFKHIDQFRGTSRFSTWLIRIATNSALQLLRQRRNRREVSFERRQEGSESWDVMEFPDTAANAEEVYAHCQARRLVSLALRRLPQSYQQLVRGCHKEELPLADVARLMGISVSAAKSRLFRARVILRAVIQGDVIKF